MVQIKQYLILVELLKKTHHNAKITEIEGNVPSISGLATTAVIVIWSNNSNLVKKKNRLERKNIRH